MIPSFLSSETLRPTPDILAAAEYCFQQAAALEVFTTDVLDVEFAGLWLAEPVAVVAAPAVDPRAAGPAAGKAIARTAKVQAYEQSAEERNLAAAQARVKEAFTGSERSEYEAAA